MPNDESERWKKRTEIVEVIVLALVTIATAWSGFQGTTWGGHQAFLYGRASTERFHADAVSTLGGQQLVADSSMFTAWLQARDGGDRGLQEQLERRFSPDYHSAFEAWLETDPFTNREAPPGPSYMPGFHNPHLRSAARLNARASSYFDSGTEAREIANKYVRDTVLFATVLFLIAVAQRFTIRGVRIGANALAIGLLVLTLVTVLDLPRMQRISPDRMMPLGHPPTVLIMDRGRPDIRSRPRWGAGRGVVWPNGRGKEPSMSQQGPGRDIGAQRWGAEKEQIDKGVRQDHLAHEADRIHAEEAAERGEAPKKKPWWKFWAIQ